jgi:S-adenosylmethionine decarboxylase
MYWGYHLMLDCAECNDNIKNKETIAMFVKDLVERIDMVAHGEPIIEYFGQDNKAGYSLLQLISTSSITGHFVDEYGHIYLDVFSCKPFESETVQECVREYFGSNKIRINYITRNAG